MNVQYRIINVMFALGFLLFCPLEVDCENQNYFTFGSTISEVVAIQGRPDSVVDEYTELPDKEDDNGFLTWKEVVTSFTFNYGKSKVRFDIDDGRVEGWYNYRNNPLKTRFNKDYILLPKHFDTDKDYFTLGATEDEVIVVQGKPDYIGRHRYKHMGESHSFVYGDIDAVSSSVEFEHGRVCGWYNATVLPLKVKLVPQKNTIEKDYFTLGSTINEVAAAQGTPDYYSESLVKYGSSEVHLHEGSVTSWKNTGSDPLKVKLLPRRKTINKGYFTLESTKDEVLAVQGTPDWHAKERPDFLPGRFCYGSSDKSLQRSTVFFENGRVIGWESKNSNPLKTGPYDGDCFTLGSTKEEVLAIQGKPEDHGDTIFRYGTAAVIFRNGCVTRWWTIGGWRRLKVKLLPKQNTDNRKYFTIGSTNDEVLTVQGTPDTYSDEMFEYSSSYVYFQNGCVAKYDNSPHSPLKVKESPNK